MKALVGAFNQEKALVGAFSVIVQPKDRFAALVVSSAVTCGQIELATAASAQESVASKLLYLKS